LAILSASICALAAAAPSQVIINEVLASNALTNLDPDFGGSGDWVELFNPGPAIIDLAAFALSDDPAQPLRWPIPVGVSIGAGEHLLIWCDGENTVGAAAHADFSLDADGESILISRLSDAGLIDGVTFGSQLTDVSLSRVPDATGGFVSTSPPTPGAPNVLLNPGPAPILSRPSGRHLGPVNVVITASAEATVRYTVDGSIPTESSPITPGFIPINVTTPLRVRAFYADRDPSAVTTASYFIGNATALPIIDLVLPPGDLFDPAVGIYSNPGERGDEWERRCHVAVIPADGSPAREVEAGLRIHGGTSREVLAKKSLRLHFREECGAPEWSLPELENTPDPTFDGLVLRAGANDSFLVPEFGQLNEATYLRDQLMRNWSGALSHRAADGFYAALYLNGEFWGLYNVCERITENLVRCTYGPGQHDILKGEFITDLGMYGLDIDEGDTEAWDALIAWVDGADLSDPADFAQFEAMVDVDNFVGNFVLNITMQNLDWPHTNFIATRRRNDPTARWHLFEWDAEWPMNLRPRGWDWNVMEWALDPENYRLANPGDGLPPLSRLFAAFIASPQGRARFIAAMEEALNFELSPAVTKRALSRESESIAALVPSEAERWEAESFSSSPELVANWSTALDRMHIFLENRPGVARQHVIEHFGLAGMEDLTLLAAGSGNGAVTVNGRAVTLPWAGTFFAGSEITLHAIPGPVSLFDDWRGDAMSPSPILVITGAATGERVLTANFSRNPGAPATPSGLQIE
jgi:hypothetical protein